MAREPFVSAFGASLSLHLLALFGLQLALTLSSPVPTRWPESPISVELFVPPPGSPAAPPVRVAAAPKAQPVARRPAPPPRPVASEVRLATAADVARRKEAPPQFVVESPPAPPAAEEAVPGVDESGLRVVNTSFGPAWVRSSGTGTGSGAFRDGFAPDTPGYYGRILGQVSVRGGGTPDSIYGRVHLFADDGSWRDYSSGSLFGYSFRHELAGGAVRDFQVGRVQTHGAYVVVTDLFRNGRISTMSHTVLFAFPREAPAGRHLYEVVEESGGDFRLHGPAGSSLVFDGKTGALRAASGFAVAPPGETGTPPRVAYRGLHLRIQSTGGNPFLRGRPATVVDARGGQCGLSTSDLFVYEGGRRESDMLRFASDRDLFAFFASRCPWLALPQPAEVQVAAPAERGEADLSGSGGLLPQLLRVFR